MCSGMVDQDFRSWGVQSSTPINRLLPLNATDVFEPNQVAWSYALSSGHVLKFGWQSMPHVNMQLVHVSSWFILVICTVLTVLPCWHQADVIMVNPFWPKLWPAVSHTYGLHLTRNERHWKGLDKLFAMRPVLTTFAGFEFWPFFLALGPKLTSCWLNFDRQ